MKTLLWVDDDGKMIDHAIHIFNRHGFHIIKATNTTEALKAIRENEKSINGILIDVVFPWGENGIEILNELQTRYPNIPKAMFTAVPNLIDMEASETYGAISYIAKPIPVGLSRQKKFFDILHSKFNNSNVKNKNIDSQQQTIHPRNESIWLRGLFYIIMFLIIVTLFTVITQLVSIWVLPVVFFGSVLSFIVINIFVFRRGGNEELSEKGFVSIIIQVLKRIPQLIKKQDKDSHS